MADAADAAPKVDTTGVEDSTKPKLSPYHYWHDHGHAKRAVGDVAPMPVHTALLSTEVKIDPVQYRAITKYSWCDNEKTVDVFIDWPNLDADAVTVDFQGDNFCADIRESDKIVHRLHVKLSKTAAPAECKFRCKPGQLAIKLKKEPVEHWFDLEAKPGLSL